MPTSAVQQKVATLSGTKIPDYSVYQALRTLLKHGLVTARRRGRELSYRLATQGNGAGSIAPRPEFPSPKDKGVARQADEPRVVHTLAVGEVAILDIGTGHVETATNVHGRLVLERHRRPK